MRASRLTHALDSGALSLPEGPVLAVGPRAGEDLSGLPPERVVAVQGFRPDHDALATRGLRVVPGLSDAPPAAAAVVFLPRSRDLARAWIAGAAARVAPGGPVAVDGQKTDGIDSLLTELRRHVALGEPVVRAHGKLAVFPAGPLPAEWNDAPRQVEGGWITRPGVFSADGPDPGSQLLAAALPPRLKGRGVDLGAGWGYLSHAALQREGVAALDLVEAEVAALECARLNVTDPRAAFHWADATRFRAARLADWVVMNPPFHAGRAADPALGAAFLTNAARILAPDGALWLVANRHLPYAAPLAALFRQVEEAGGDGTFRVLRCTRPAPQPGGRR